MVVFIGYRSFIPKLFLACLNFFAISASAPWGDDVESWLDDCMENDEKNQIFYECKVKGYIFSQLELFIWWGIHTFQNVYLFIIGTEVATPTKHLSFTHFFLSAILFCWFRFVAVFCSFLVFFGQFDWSRVCIRTLVSHLLLHYCLSEDAEFGAEDARSVVDLGSISRLMGMERLLIEAVSDLCRKVHATYFLIIISVK